MRFRSIAGALALTALFSGCLATVPKIDAQRAGDAQTKAQIVTAIQNPTIDTDGHLLSLWIRGTMISAFSIRAKQLGLHIDPNGVPVTIHITGVRSRSDAARIIFNFFDGADWVSATVDVGNASFDVQEDTWLYWMPTWHRSVQEVAEAVGKQVANGLALVAGMPTED